MNKMGRYAFLGGLVLAIAAGLGVDQPWVGWVLAVLGGIVGFMNIGESERTDFLIAGMALAISVTAFAAVPWIGERLTMLTAAVLPFVGGAVFVVAILALFHTGRD